LCCFFCLSRARDVVPSALLLPTFIAEYASRLHPLIMFWRGIVQR
jgi:hypothetical protein